MTDRLLELASVRWARGERGYCGKCGHEFALVKRGVIRKHTRLFVGGQRFVCEGSHEKDVTMEAAIRATLGEKPSDE